MVASRSLGRLNEPILQRICGEYLEMPGLQLTLKQAQRLWGLDEETCARSLDLLVENGFLVRTSRDSYARLTEGNIALPTLRMAKASIYRLRASGVDRARASQAHWWLLCANPAGRNAMLSANVLIVDDEPRIRFSLRECRCRQSCCDFSRRRP